MSAQTLKKQTRPLDLAIRCARKRQSPQTNWIHFHHKSPFSKADSIPVFENLCFILALFRLREADPIQEGKELLTKLLSYQSDQGAFPQYLHEYPDMISPKKNLKLLFLLKWIYRQFHSILEPALKEKLSKGIEKLESLLSQEELNGLDELVYQTQREEAVDTSYWEGRIFDLKPNSLAKLLIHRPELRESIEHVYDPSHRIYMGPFAQQNQVHPELTLLDLIFLEEDTSFLKRYPEDHILYLQGALLPHYPLSDGERSEYLIARDSYFRMIWGEKESVDILVCDREHNALHQKEELHLYYELEEKELEEEFELSFYLPYKEETQVWIEQDKGTIFQPGEIVTLQSKEKKIDMEFILLEGKGEFCGHVLMANRPNQVRKGRFEAYDWQIGFRTVRRKEACKILVKIRPS